MPKADNPARTVKVELPGLIGNIVAIAGLAFAIAQHGLVRKQGSGRYDRDCIQYDKRQLKSHTRFQIESQMNTNGGTIALPFRVHPRLLLRLAIEFADVAVSFCIAILDVRHGEQFAIDPLHPKHLAEIQRPSPASSKHRKLISALVNRPIPI
jgi:hypothetical protein